MYFHRSRRTIGFGSAFVAVAASVTLVACGSSHSGGTAASTVPGSATSTNVLPSAGLAGLVSGPFVAVVNDTPILVGTDGSTARLVPNLRKGGLVAASSGDAVMVSFLPRGLVFSGPSDNHFPGAVPAGVAPIPDALGRFWSNFGQLDAKGQLRQIAIPPGNASRREAAGRVSPHRHQAHGAVPVAEGQPPKRVASGTTRVLAVAGDLVAYGGDTGNVVHVLNLATGRTTELHPDGFAMTARFSPDRSRLALFVLADGGQESVALADPASGRVITRIDTSATSAGLHQFRGFAGRVPARAVQLGRNRCSARRRGARSRFPGGRLRRGHRRHDRPNGARAGRSRADRGPEQGVALIVGGEREPAQYAPRRKSTTGTVFATIARSVSNDQLST